MKITDPPDKITDLHSPPANIKIDFGQDAMRGRKP